MISTKNPFPGMNPYLELSWHDVHTKLIGYISDALAAELPADLYPRAEERVSVSDQHGAPIYRADVAVTETWKRGLVPAWTPEDKGLESVTLAEPEIVAMEPTTERWIEIRERSGTLVTVIELLSPSNKVGRGAAAYIGKQQEYLSAAVNLVEIDLLRAGRYVMQVPAEGLKPAEGVRYMMTVSRGVLLYRFEVYFCPLRERLPAIRIPLRPTDRDVPLNLQPLLDRCYETGRYWLTDFGVALTPPFDEDDQAWINARLKSAGLAD